MRHVPLYTNQSQKKHDRIAGSDNQGPFRQFSYTMSRVGWTSTCSAGGGWLPTVCEGESRLRPTGRSGDEHRL
jgi:hypothetical protein